jgi:hypothetical protein
MCLTVTVTLITGSQLKLQALQTSFATILYGAAKSSIAARLAETAI